MNRIKQLRQEKNLTLKQLGNKLGMLDSTLSQYENEKRMPKDEVWSKMAKFFNVSVPYLKGLTLDANQLAQRLIPIIHNSYFDTWFFIHGKNKKTKKVFNHYSPELVDNLDTYIVLTGSGKEPWQLYPKSEVDFKLTKQVAKYWRKCLNPLFDKMATKTLLTSFENDILLNEFEATLKKQKNILVHQSSNVTALGFFYEAEFDNENYSENRLHDKMRAMLLHGDYEVAKKTVDEYFEIISNLKEQVDSFNEIDYFKYRLNEMAIPMQKVNNPSKEKSAILDEIKGRVNKGDNDLLRFIMVHDGEDLPRVYRSYKKKHHEDTTELDEYINNPHHALPYEIFQNKKFLKYLEKYINDDKSNKPIDIQKAYDEFLKDKNK